MKTKRRFTKNLLNIVLKDDDTSFGGLSYSNQNLKSFLEEIDVPIYTLLSKVNEYLVECGILPIHNRYERKLTSLKRIKQILKPNINYNLC